VESNPYLTRSGPERITPAPLTEENVKEFTLEQLQETSQFVTGGRKMAPPPYAWSGPSSGYTGCDSDYDGWKALGKPGTSSERLEAVKNFTGGDDAISKQILFWRSKHYGF
jgi:hypothetical protein